MKWQWLQPNPFATCESFMTIRNTIIIDFHEVNHYDKHQAVILNPPPAH